MHKKEDILSKVDRKTGMTVPNGYFADFANQLEEKLPEKTWPEEEVVRPALWIRIRPYVYMAAMFAGVWCMLKMFSLMIPAASKEEVPFPQTQAFAQAIENESFVQDYYLNQVGEYDLLQDMYDEGFDTGSLSNDN